jgi:uncharacterized protein YgiM (DUF1202 family)
MLGTIVVCCLVFALAQTVVAAEMRLSDSGVNFRAAPSTDSNIIRSLGKDEAVEVLEHNPVGWSKVTSKGATGYIRSDFLTIPSGADAVVSSLAGKVNLRTGPSTNAEIIKTLGAGTDVKVYEHDPKGWSKVSHNGTTGYIKSDYLAIAAGAGKMTLKTIDGVNFRAGPSTDSGIIKTLGANTSVEVLESTPAAWSKVKVEGTVGYIRSDLLSATGRAVELLEWPVVSEMIKCGVPIHAIDVRTGRSYTIQCFSKGAHADVEPLTRADTDTMFDVRGGVWSWAARPVWVTIGDHLVAASLHGMPHDVSTISNNGMNGHLCLHFRGSTAGNSSQSYKQDMQNAVLEAWNAR